MRRPGNPREEGLVLILVLVVITLTISTVYAFARTSLLSLLAQQQRMDRVRAELLARSALPIAYRALADDRLAEEEGLLTGLESAEDPWALLSRQTIEVPGNGELRLRVQDIGHRINLNGLVDAEGEPHEDSKPFVEAALERIIEHMPGRQEEKLYKIDELADAILDWIDANEETRLGDNERPYYLDRGAEAPPPDRPVWTLAELAEIPGMDDRLLGALGAYFTTHPLYPSEGSGVNPNTAPPHVLGLIYLGTGGEERRLLDEKAVFAILRARRQEQIFCPSEGEEPCISFEAEVGRIGESVFPPLSYSSDIFSIRSEGRFGDSRACITTVIDRQDLVEVKTLAYRTGC